MPITVPTPLTPVMAEDFGIPVANQLNALVPTAWTNATYQNSWVTFGSPYPPLQYRKIGDITYLRGMIKDGTLNLNICVPLPVEFRSPYLLQFSTVTYGTFGYFNVQSDGSIQIAGGNVSGVSIMANWSTIV